MTCYLSSAFIIYRLRFCALKTHRRHPHKRKEISISDAISDEDISHIEQGHTSVVIISTEAINKPEEFRKNNMILIKYTQ